MESMADNWFIAVGLTINAFFLRGIYSEVNAVKVTMAEIFADTKHSKEEIDNLRERYHNLVNELQTVKLQIEKLSRKQ